MTFLPVGPASGKKKINIISITAVLILQTKNQVLTEHSNCTTDSTILWLK